MIDLHYYFVIQNMSFSRLFNDILFYQYLNFNPFIYSCSQINSYSACFQIVIHLVCWTVFISFIINLYSHFLILRSFILAMYNKYWNKLTVKILLVDEDNWIGILLLRTNLKIVIINWNILLIKSVG